VWCSAPISLPVFPRETEAMFANTLDMVEEARLTYLHCIPLFGRVEGTPCRPACRKWPKPVRKERAARHGARAG